MIQNIITAIRNIFRPGQHNVVKIVCLALGLASSAVIIAEIYFEQTYDTFFPEYKRTYRVNEDVIRDGELKEWPQTSGAIAHGIKAYAPMVEAATRYTPVFLGGCEVGGQKDVETFVTLADSCFFDVLPRPILQGNARQTLSRPFYCMVSRSYAEKVGGNVVGKRIVGVGFLGTLTIGGVFDNYPRNSSLSDMEVVASLNTFHAFPGADGTERWIGNDRYRSFIRLSPGADIAGLKPYVGRMMRERMPMEEMKKSGVDMDFSFTNISEAYTHDPYVKKMFWIMSILAFVLLFSSVMNYLLVVIGNIVTRSREMAVRKCFGASHRNIYGVVMAEAEVHVVLAVALGGLLVFVCKGTIEQFLSAPISVLLFNRGAWIILAICLVVLIIGGLVPGWLYSRTHVIAAFRGYAEARRRWKLALLSVQFVAASLLFALLFVINAQYSRLVNDDTGYQYNGLVVVGIDGADANQRGAVAAELRRLPEVEAVSSSDVLPIRQPSGNNISLPGSDKELFNAADLYNVSDGYFALMGITIVQGQGFTGRSDSLSQVMVSRSFAEKLRTDAHISGSVVGHRLFVSEHCDSLRPSYSICGVYDDIRLGSATEPDDRPSMMFYSRETLGNILVRLHNLTPETVDKVRAKAEAVCPDNKVAVDAYSTMIADMYVSQRNFRSGVLVSGIITLLIALSGLVGYTVDEVNRRRKEIAIRKVNGAEVADILRLFLSTVLYVAVPSVTVGCVAAFAISSQWLQSFAERIFLTPVPFVVAGLAVLIVIAVAIVANSFKVARSNPVRYLKDE